MSVGEDDWTVVARLKGLFGTTWIGVSVTSIGELKLEKMGQNSIDADALEAQTWDVTLVSLINNLNRIRNQIVSITGEDWGTVTNPLTNYTLKSLFNANTILKADADNTPAALAVAASRVVGRKSSGGIAALTVAELKTMLDYELTELATGAEIKALYEVEDYAFTDTKNTKLAGIDEEADVTAANPPQVHGNDKHTNRTRYIYAPIHWEVEGGSRWGTSNYYPGILLNGDGQACRGIIRLPEDYVSDAVLYAVGTAGGTGNFVLDVHCMWNQFGETQNANQDVHVNESIPVVISVLNKFNLHVDFDNPDVGSAPTAGELLVVKIIDTGAGVNGFIMGLLLEYVGDQ